MALTPQQQGVNAIVAGRGGVRAPAPPQQPNLGYGVNPTAVGQAAGAYAAMHGRSPSTGQQIGDYYIMAGRGAPPPPPNPYGTAAPQSTPGPSPSTPGPAPPPKPGPSPLDSTYFANVNAHNFGVGNQINALAKQSGYNTTDYNDQLGNLAYQQPRDELQAEEAAGRRGGVYSTVLDQQLGDLTHSYQTKGADLLKAYTRNQTAIASQGNALWGGIPLYASQQAADAAVRAANANAKNPALGESTKPLTRAQQSSTHRLATALATAHKTGKTQRTLTQGRTVISRPNGTQQATHTAGGMFGGTVTRTPAQTAALRALLGGK